MKLGALAVIVGCGGLSGGTKATSTSSGSGAGGAATSSTDSQSSSSHSGAATSSTAASSGIGPASASASGASSSGTGGGSTSCASLPLCDGFETDTAGMPPNPSAWTVLMGCNPNMQNTTAPGGGLYVQVDSSQAHSGNNSLRVVGGDSCGYYAINTSAFASLGSQVYARFWIRFSGAPTANHNGFLSMYSGTATNFLMNYSNAEQLRLGFQGNVVVWNYLSSDATLPDIDPMGEMTSVATPADAWSCLEFHLDQTTANIEFWYQASASSTEASVSGLSYDGTSTQGVSDNWHSGGPTSLLLKSFGLGWLGLNDQYTVWYDDVALGDSRIGCQ